MAQSVNHQPLPETYADWVKVARECHYCGKEMACRLDYSEVQLRRICGKRFGVNLKYWLCWQRMVAAAETLRRTGSIPETAWDLGFSHVSSFCRAFKAGHGLTPGEYLASIRRWIIPAKPKQPWRNPQYPLILCRRLTAMIDFANR